MPWLSLVLLFAAYTTFSWFITNATATWLVWVMVLTFTLTQALLLTTWFDGFKRFLNRWLRSDVGYFTLIIVASLSLTLALVWFKTFGYILVLISSELLARLDLQTAGFNRLQALIILTIFSLAGLATGWSASQHPLFRLPALATV
ncbi:MAG: hypothetical protein IGS50_11770 [Synechococcales cyanobacterium C42_A2020_086]|jgi:hypothetical protein|nr:hypothetical protein [Synechococcales cyanobacterium M58_A2018_015]MBF2074422.1 hypothetical protein [Synechococcales cyanobacterium C42_A2020_086]